MPRVTPKSVVLTQAHAAFPSFLRQRANVDQLNFWITGKQAESDGGSVYIPTERVVTSEYDDLVAKSFTPWAGLIVTSLAQTLFLEGIRRPGATENMQVYSIWQENGWDARQIPLHRAAIGHGLAFATALPARSRITGELTALMRGHSARKMAAFYDDDGEDEWPAFALRCEKEQVTGVSGTVDDFWAVRFYDETAIHYLSCVGDGEDPDDWTYISYEEHGLGVTPVVRYANLLDLDGQATSEIDPVLPLLRRIDQDTFDRLIVQRFGAWKVRFAAGLVKPETTEEQRAEAIRLKVEDILISDSPDTRFGTLDETQLEGFIKARDADLRDAAAVTQTPPHHLLGLSSNLQAEALATAEAGLRRKGEERRVCFGESHEMLARLSAMCAGNLEEATAFDAQVRWKDTESRSLAQAADALAKIADSLGVPVEMLWERIPNWTDADSARAKVLLQNGTIDRLIDALELGNTGAPPAPPTATGDTGGDGS